jgi:hypothetical protein
MTPPRTTPNMTDSLPKFDAPPVIETILSLQFARLSGFSTAMVGWFWKLYLAKLSGGENWTKAVETGRLEDQLERFGVDELWARLGIALVPAESQRTQIIRAGDERMLQIQDSRLVLNWRKQLGPYPPAGGADILAETMSADWRFGLAGERGRLYVGLRHAKTTPSSAEVMHLTLTARGPIDQEKGWTATEGFELGHSAIVRTFTSMTSADAHKRWQRRI